MSMGAIPCRGYMLQLVPHLYYRFNIERDETFREYLQNLLDEIVEEVLDIVILNELREEHNQLPLEKPYQVGDIWDYLEDKDLDVTIKYVLEAMAEDDCYIHVDINGQDVICDLFRYNSRNGDCYDDLEDGQVYLIFSDHYLYTCEKTDLGKYLTEHDIMPIEQSWVVYG